MYANLNRKCNISLENMRSATDFGGGKRGRLAKVSRGNMDPIWIYLTGILQEKGWWNLSH